MLTKLCLRKFKRFEEVEIELGSPVVFVDPNNSGKTSALQALASGTLDSSDGTSAVPDGRPPKNARGLPSTAGTSSQFPFRTPTFSGASFMSAM